MKPIKGDQNTMRRWDRIDSAWLNLEILDQEKLNLEKPDPENLAQEKQEVRLDKII